MKNIFGSWRWKISFKNVETGKREWYVGGLLFTEEEANEEVKVTMEEYIENWEIDGCEDVHEDLFDIEILEV